MVPVIVSLAGSASSWLLQALFGLLCATVVAIYTHRFWAHTAHHRDLKDVDEANGKLLQIHADVRPTYKPPLANYASVAERKGILPTQVDPNSHVLYRDYAPSHPSHMPPLSAAHVPADHQQLKVTNNIDIGLQLTCQQLPTFVCFLKSGHTVAIPNTTNSLATISAQGYFEDHSAVKLVLQIDTDKVLHVCVDTIDGIIQMHACVN